MVQKVIKQTLIIVVLILLQIITASLTLASDGKLSFERKYLSFDILESELQEGRYIIGDKEKLGFVPYDGMEMPNNRPTKNRMITLRSEFSIDSNFVTNDIYLVVLPIDYYCKIFFNGILIGIRGSKNGKYTSRIHYSEKILIPKEKINYSGKNEIALQLYPIEGEVFPVSGIFIANAKDASKYVFLRNLVGPKLIFALTLCGLVFFLFFLTVYITRREYQKQHFLFFALMNLFFLLSYVNNIFTNDFSHTFLYEKIARISFPLSVYVAICFLIEYTNVYENKKRIKLIFLLAYIPAIVMVLLPRTTMGTIKAYNTYPLLTLLVGSIVLFVIAHKYYMKEKSIKSGFLLFIFFFNILAGFHDGIYFAILKTKPFILLTPNTVFGINLVIFFILAVDHSKLYHLAINSTKKLEKLNQELEDLVEQRTQKTVEYAAKLEEANKTKDKFFSIIAHDLKNPFNTLIGYSDILKSEFRDYGPDEIHEQLQIIYNTSIKGYNLLENLLKWSQTQTNQISFIPSEVNLNELIQICIDDVGYQCQFKDIEIHNDIPEDLTIIADKNLLKTILRNLINNSVKFTNRNGMVTVTCNKNEEHIEINVKDTGVGMSQFDIENLFKIDKVLSKPGTEKETGSGLGLILCKEFVEKHGGKIWVKSEIDVGSEFIFTIPKIETSILN